MPRIPYLSDQAADLIPASAAVRARRGGGLLNLDRMLLHSPALAQNWNSYLGAVRGALTLPAKLRELAVCAVAVLNCADYEFTQHAPEFLRAGGTGAQLQALRLLGSGVAAATDTTFDAAESAVLTLTIEMTRLVAVSDIAFESVRTQLSSEQQVVELVGVIATYNMVSRFLVALGVDQESAAALPV
jgi:alkylhydroperoxidase family enzyme